MHIFAPVASTLFPNLDGVVIFEMRPDDDQNVYLVIRFASFKRGIVDGDHLYTEPFEDVKRDAEVTYAIEPTAWRELLPSEVTMIEESFG